MQYALKHDGKAQPSLTPRRGDLCPGRGLPVSLGRSRSSSSNHHVSVLVYKHDISYTSGASDRGKMTASLPLPLERRDPETSHHKDRGGRLRSTRARRRRAPVDVTGRRRARGLRSNAESPPLFIPQRRTIPTTSSHSKITLDAKDSRKQGPPTKDPVQHGLVDLFTPSRDPPKSRAPP